MNYKDEIQVRRTGEQVAVYVNGHFVLSGTQSEADAWLRRKCGVVMVDDPDGHWFDRHPGGILPVTRLLMVEERAYQARKKVRESGA